MMKSKVAILILMLFPNVFWAQYQGYNAVLEDSELNQETAIQLLANSRTVDRDSMEFMLEKSVDISKNISFDEGVQNGYRELIEMYKREGKVSSELRNRLQFLRYLEQSENAPALGHEEYKVGLLYLEQGIYAKAIESLERAHQLTRDSDEWISFQAQKGTAWSLFKFGNYRDAKTAYYKAFRLAKELKATQDQLWIQQQLARIAHAQGKYKEELLISTKVRNLADSLGREDVYLKAVNNMGYACKYLKRPEDAARFFEEALLILQSRPNPSLEADVLLNLGVIYQNRKDYYAAIKVLNASIDKAGQIGKKEHIGNAYDLLALIYYHQKDPHNALVYNDKSIQIARKERFPQLLMRSYESRSLICQSLYEFEDALAAQEQFWFIRDSIQDAFQSGKEGAMQEQIVMERLEKQMRLSWVRQEVVELEKEKLRIQAVATEQEKKRLVKENELKDVKLDFLRTDSARRVAALNFERQKSQTNKIQQARKIELLELDKQTANAKEKEILATQAIKDLKLQEYETLEQKRLADAAGVENDSQKERIRYMTMMIGGLGLFVLLILLALWGLRKRNLKIQKQQVVIAAEKEKSDKLLLNILPAQVAEELKEKGVSPPRQYENVSVVFTDFVGFTHISERLKAEKLIQNLDAIFLEFDLIVERNGLHRIKTIGDAYMCAGGLPEIDPDHAPKAVKSALEMRDFMAKFNQGLPMDQPKWEIRIGVNSGPVVAGVVGIRKFAYDIWGDTVNTASRMESSGQAGKVNISGTTQKLLNGEFALEYRGKVAAKNKGEIDMYFVEMEKA